MPVDEGQGAQPYDPAEMRPDVFGPQDEPWEAGALRDEAGDLLPSFDQRYVDGLDGLLFIGALSDSFEWLGHRFVIRTLTQDELLTVPLLIKEWQGTIGEPKAYTTAMVALCTVSVDGKELPSPIGEGDGGYAWAFQRFNYVKSRWFQFTIDQVYSRYLALEAQVQRVVEAMEKASGSTDSTRGLSGDSVEPSAEGS